MIVTLTFAAALGSGLIAGLLFTFSNFAMKAFSELPPNQGISAMKKINTVIINPLFLGIFMGTALLSAFFIINYFFQWLPGNSKWTLTGGYLYLFGVFIITVAVNVPLNNQLDSVDSDQSEGISFWKNYLTFWTRWNHVRTVAAISASSAFMLALI
jgi:uncharacterized membrane protein